MADHEDQEPVIDDQLEQLRLENENLRRQVFRAESVIKEYRQELDAQGFELKKLRAELKLQAQLAQPTA
ncbi:hypothetical protein [Glutamicibacter sp. MCAF14]|uniref:hypothetical protein n=1 Tax=Glutamicibacter sp. MCAF14 TaxID=3233043 RepID=UPI003F930104